MLSPRNEGHSSRCPGSLPRPPPPEPGAPARRPAGPPGAGRRSGRSCLTGWGCPKGPGAARRAAPPRPTCRRTRRPERRTGPAPPRAPSVPGRATGTPPGHRPVAPGPTRRPRSRRRIRAPGRRSPPATYGAARRRPSGPARGSRPSRGRGRAIRARRRRWPPRRASRSPSRSRPPRPCRPALDGSAGHARRAVARQAQRGVAGSGLPRNCRVDRPCSKVPALVTWKTLAAHSASSGPSASASSSGLHT